MNTLAKFTAGVSIICIAFFVLAVIDRVIDTWLGKNGRE